MAVERPQNRHPLYPSLSQIAVLAFVTLFVSFIVPRGPPPSQNGELDDLLIAHSLLHHTLGKEAQLQYLYWLRKGTFRKHSNDLERLTQRVYQTSSTRLGELQGLFELEPAIDLKQAPVSKIGDDIQGIAESKGTVEMTNPILLGQYPARFYFLQAQATRMVAAIAKAAAGVERNASRKRFLKELTSEYEGIREELVEAVSNSCLEL